jgi:hypothetical protein
MATRVKPGVLARARNVNEGKRMRNADPSPRVDPMP